MIFFYVCKLIKFINNTPLETKKPNSVKDYKWPNSKYKTIKYSTIINKYSTM